LIQVTYSFSDVGNIVIEGKILGFGVQLEGKVLLQVELEVKIITGCSSICIRHCGKTLIGNIESILDFDVY
jgi:hypothetical protein